MPTNTNLASRMNKYLPSELVAFLKTFGYTAAKQKQDIYLVGGAVRDLLLGLSHLDLDLVIEGDAIKLAKSLRFNRIKITTHPAFGTVTIKWNHWSVDIATARSEIYPHPGALPEVTPSTINKDLFRRDFTINSMAVSLNPENYGDLIDPYRGLPDLKNKLIRIMHEQSFIDDATRIWRAIRYEQRLNFTIEKDTLQCLKRDINMLENISGDRIRHELELVLQEKRPEKAIHRADELNILSKLNSNLSGNSWLSDKFSEAREMGLTEHSLTTVYLALLVYHLNGEALIQFTTSLHMKKSLSQILKETIVLRENLPKLAKTDVTASEVYFTLNDYSVLAIIANSIATESISIKRHIDNYINRLCHLKPRLNGDDLKRMGIIQGPEIKTILHLLHAAKLDGKVITKQGEIRLVYSWLRKQQNNDG